MPYLYHIPLGGLGFLFLTFFSAMILIAQAIILPAVLGSDISFGTGGFSISAYEPYVSDFVASTILLYVAFVAGLELRACREVT